MWRLPMNYEKIYLALISNAKSLQENRNDEQYYERHHIIPRSMNGSNTNDNLIILTAKEHFVAHHLLWRMYKNTEFRFKMAKAFLCMTRNSNGQERYYSARGYEEAKKAHSIVMKLWMEEGNHPKGMKGKKHSEETKQRISENTKLACKNRGLLKPVYKFSKDGNLLNKYDSMSDGAIAVNGNASNIKYTCEGKFKTAYGFRWSYSPNKCEMKSLKRKEHYHTEEHKKDMSDKISGTIVVKDNRGYNFRISVNDPRYKSGELISAVVGTKKPTKQCEWCKKIISTTNYTRWHGKQCKHKKENINE